MLIAIALAGCGGGADHGSRTGAEGTLEARRGREIWFTATYGGERFFARLASAPDPLRRIDLAFEAVVGTPRSMRFQTWGTINDPDCRADPAGGPDRCADPHATGVIGIRKFVAPDGATLYGVACASCHAGFDPLRPPRRASEPTWANIHPTIGNPYLKVGKIFSHHMAPDDVRRILFDAWPEGTVDTTLLFDDHIMNPSLLAPIWDLPQRATFDVHESERKVRSGRGGEDDLGMQTAALRVFTSLGVCHEACVAPSADRPDASAPIDVAACRAKCSDLPPQRDLDDLTAFLSVMRSPKFPFAPMSKARFAEGKRIFEEQCASCHATRGEGRLVLTGDEVIAIDRVGTNACRALTTSWDEGQLWAPFSSPVYAARKAKGYRTPQLAGIWATAPFLHNESVGTRALPTATPRQRAAEYEASMRQLLSADRVPQVDVLPRAVGTLPAGTPLAFIFSVDPVTREVLCKDVVQNRGHTFGSHLADRDKDSLIYWLEFQ